MLRFAALPLLLTFASAPALAGGDKLEPVCAGMNVLDRLAEALRQAGRPQFLERATVGEVSTAPGNLIRCAVRAHRLAFDTNRDGTLPLDQTQVVQYTLELRHNGIFLHLN